MDLKKSLENFIEEISSSSPTPGGGSVSAFNGVLGTSLGLMVCNLTIGKKKYESVEAEVLEIKNRLQNFREKFLELYDEDSKAFDKVMEAIKLPKESEEDKIKRTHAIEDATVYATEIPINVIQACSEVTNDLIRLSEIGNQNSLSDAGVALILIKSSAEGAMLNVMINTRSLNDRDRAMNLVLSAAQKLTELEAKIDEALKNIKKKLEL
ncbi:MAG: cyclodeaminase/cyclohydrolase family protein [Ignavibacteria bacterium]|jgi:glutamate formiminotransferase/formiminotetrahydrofolate cyclodeaminase|nr:cyclodeaminase/cyclohydrolase family protein [Ignavibacteria bacterium]MDH7528778.1 cyclodeaminase/cyclohydrolase family protein [Ignavibacteria bacterium]